MPQHYNTAPGTYPIRAAHMDDKLCVLPDRSATRFSEFLQLSLVQDIGENASGG